MSRNAPVPAPRAEGPLRSPWTHVTRVAAALAAGMGVGRFVYTPILPLMHTQAGLSTAAGAHLATANYVGYLLGALAGTPPPRPGPLPHGPARLVRPADRHAGRDARHPQHHGMDRPPSGGRGGERADLRGRGRLTPRPAAAQPPCAHARLGLRRCGRAGIALSGLLVLTLRSVADWRTAWWSSAALAAALATAAWNLRPEAPPAPSTDAPEKVVDPWFGALFAGYTLEGVGYIVAGTFLVAAIGQGSPGWIGSGAWVLVGLAAVPSSAMWARLGRRWSRPGLLCGALVIQAVGIALPALVGGVAAALVSAVLFGATFIGVSTLALAAGVELQFPRSVALLTHRLLRRPDPRPPRRGPLLHHGYRPALLLAAAVVLAAAVAAAVLRLGFPRPQAVAVRESAPAREVRSAGR